MDTFDKIWKRAAKHHGGDAAVEKLLPKPATAAKLRKVPDDRWLAAMAKQVFRAGFAWKVIEAKWDGFEAAFGGFDARALVMQPDEAMDALVSDRRIVRNPQKIRATFQNARFVCDIADAHGGFGKYVADWPGQDITGLWQVFKKQGARLGGMTGPSCCAPWARTHFSWAATWSRRWSAPAWSTRRPRASGICRRPRRPSMAGRRRAAGRCARSAACWR